MQSIPLLHNVHIHINYVRKINKSYIEIHVQRSRKLKFSPSLVYNLQCSYFKHKLIGFFLFVCYTATTTPLILISFCNVKAHFHNKNKLENIKKFHSHIYIKH